MTTTATTTIIIADDNGTSAPLYSQYGGQINPQPAYLEFDPRDDGLTLTAEYSGEIGNGVPGRVWHGVVRRYTVPCYVSRAALEELADNAEVAALLAQIKEGYACDHDGSNWAGSLTEAALEAEERLERLLSEMETAEIITNLAEWLAAGSREDWMPDDGADVAQYIADYYIDGETTEDVGVVLAEMWANELYSGEPLPPNVARYLLEQGTCSDSQWIPELTAYAEGRDPNEEGAE